MAELVPPILRVRVVQKFMRRADGIDIESSAVAAVHHEVTRDVRAPGTLHPKVDVAIVVDVACRDALDVQVRGPAVLRIGVLPMFSAHGVGQRRRPDQPPTAAQVQLRWISESAPVAAPFEVDPGVEDSQVRPAVAVEVRGDADRRVGTPQSSNEPARSTPEPTVPHPEEHPHGCLPQPVLGGPRAAVVVSPPEQEVIPAVAVEVGHGDDPVVAPEALRLDVRERLRLSRHAGGRGEEQCRHAVGRHRFSSPWIACPSGDQNHDGDCGDRPLHRHLLPLLLRRIG